MNSTQGAIEKLLNMFENVKSIASPNEKAKAIYNMFGVIEKIKVVAQDKGIEVEYAETFVEVSNWLDAQVGNA